METITLGAGCFWCLEAVFSRLKGVIQSESGYCGGTMPNPTYSQVCSGTTGHAEVVQVTFDPAQISLQTILSVFFSLHDPTTLNRQGADVGTQYRSALFYHTEEQKRVAQEMISSINRVGTWGRPVVTEVVPLPPFYPAEEYHQRYYERNPDQGYCRAVIRPKVDHLEKQFPDALSS
jgi:methionine-S-sulfoxide reductase